MLRDFGKGRSHIVTWINAKLRFWNQLPYILCGLAHPVAETARAAGSRALALFLSSPTHARHHRITQIFLDEGGVLREHLLAFIRGQPLHELHQDFQMWLARFSQVYVVERLLEGVHKTMWQNSRMACRNNNTYASMCVRGLGLTRRIKAQLALLRTMVSLCARTTKPLSAVKALGFGSHPGTGIALDREGRFDVLFSMYACMHVCM